MLYLQAGNDDEKVKVENREMSYDEVERLTGAILRTPVTNGKNRLVLETILSIQSWPFGGKKEPSAPIPGSNLQKVGTRSMHLQYSFSILVSLCNIYREDVVRRAYYMGY